MQDWLKSVPWAGSKWLARMRSKAPRLGTPRSSRAWRRSLPKSTFAWKREMSPLASAVPWARSRHQAAEVRMVARSRTEGRGSWVRNATLKNAAGRAAAPAPPGWVESARPGQEVASARPVPEADPGGEPHAATPGVPLPVGDAERDLAPAEVDADPRGAPADQPAAPRPHHLGPKSRSPGAHGQEQARGGAHVLAVRKFVEMAPAAADRDRERDQRRMLQGVHGDPQQRRAAERLRGELDKVSRVARVAPIGRIGVRAVRLREEVPAGARVGGVGRQPSAVVVVDEVLVEELAAPEGRRPRGGRPGRPSGVSPDDSATGISPTLPPAGTRRDGAVGRIFVRC